MRRAAELLFDSEAAAVSFGGSGVEAFSAAGAVAEAAGGSGSAAAAEAFEVLAAAQALGGARSVPLLQGGYGFQAQPPVADCTELVTRELLNALLL